MCQYMQTTYRCTHTRTQPKPPCTLMPACTRDQDALVRLNEDLGNTRAAIRLFNTDRDSANCKSILNHMKREYKAYFGHGSGNGDDVMESLRQIEGYLGGEIGAVGGRVTEKVGSEEMCLDGCWEGVVILGLEAQEGRMRGGR